MGFAFKLELLKRLDKLDATMKLFTKSFVESNREVLSQLKNLTEKICNMSKVQQDLEQDIKDLNDATNSVADVLTSIRNQLKDGLTPAEANALKLELDSVIGRTRQLAADPNQVVPPVIPPADTTTGTGGTDTTTGAGGTDTTAVAGGTDTTTGAGGTDTTTGAGGQDTTVGTGGQF